MTDFRKLVFTAIAICSLSVSCRQIEPVYHEDFTRDPRQGKLIHEECVKNVYLTAEQVKKVVCVGKDKDQYLSDRVKRGVSCYKLRYWTVAMHPDRMVQQLVLADALLLVPDHEKNEELPYATYFHGTIPPMNSLEMIASTLPSNFKGTTTSKDMMYCALPLAAAGYCVIAPDYTGYGPTAGWIHPFIYYPELYKSALDGMAAGVYMADSLGVSLQESNMPGIKKVWLTGWSQGGGLSMYMQQRIERQNGNTFRVMGNSVLAAPCNCYHMITDLFEPDPSGNRKDEFKLVLALYSWATYCFNVFAEELRRPFDQIFRMDIYSQIGALLVTPQKPSELYQDFFIKHIEDSTDVDFINAMKKNCTHSDWTPNAPLIMHHGKSDILVNYFNMEDAIKGLKLADRRLDINDHTQNAAYTEYADSEPDRINYEPGHDNFVPKYMAHTIDCFNAWRAINGD